MITYVQEQHIAILLETRTNDLTRLSSGLHSHTICYHNNVEIGGRRGQGVAVFLHSSLEGLVQMWKVSEFFQAVWLRINGSVFGVQGRVLLGAVYINPQSSTRSDNDISLMFSHLQNDISEAQNESQHLILLGDFNAHLDNVPDQFPEGHISMLLRIPELGSTRVGQYKDRANTAGRCLKDIALETPLILTTGRGKGDRGQPTFFGYNTPFNPSRTEHILMSIALFFCCQNISVLHDFDSADHRPLLCHFKCKCLLPHIDLRLPSQIVRKGRGKHLVWKSEHKDAFASHILESETALQFFRDSVRNQEHQTSYQCFLDLIIHAADATGMTARQVSRRRQLGLPMAPWFDATCHNFKRRIRWNTRHNQHDAELKKEFNTYCRLRKRQYKKEKADEVVGLIDSRSPEVYKLMTANKHAEISPISAEAWTQHLRSHFVQPQENVSDMMGVRSNLPTRHQLLSGQLRSGQVLPSDIAVPPGPGGRFRQMNTTFLRSTERAPVYKLPPTHTLATTVQKNISKVNMQSSPGFDPFSASFIKHAEKTVQDERGKRHTENVLLPLLTDLFHLFLSDGVTPYLWNKVKITPLHKKGPTTSPQNYRLLAINGCIYRLFANVVRDLLTDWALAEHQIPDSQFGFCPTRNTIQPLFVLRHILATAKKEKRKVYTAFLDLLAAYDSIPRERLWEHLQKIRTPQYLRDIIQTMYRGCLYLLVDGDKFSEEVAPNRGLKQGCPLSPLLYSLYTNDIDRFLDVQKGAVTALDPVKVPHCDYADDIALTSNTAENLQFQLDRIYAYTRFKGLKLNTDKTKVMVFFSNDTYAVSTFRYNGTPLELVNEFKYLGIILTRSGKMHTATAKMADTFRNAIARVFKTGDNKGIKHRKHAMLWLFQVFALTAGLYGCQIWATSFLTYDSSKTTSAHVLHVGFLKQLLGVKKGTDTHSLLRETGQVPIFFYWFRCTVRFWNSLLSSNNLLLEKVVRADLLLANRSDTWTYQVLHALQDLPASHQLLDAIRSRESINLKQFELTLREHIIGGWRELDILTPHEAHHSSRIMRTYHTHFGVPLGTAPGWWDDKKRNHKPVLPLYLRKDLSSNLSRALSCLRLSCHNFLVQKMRHARNRIPYELRICDKCDWHIVQDEEHVLLDCPHEQLVSLRTQHQLFFPPQYEDSTTRLRNFMNQPDVSGVASFVAKCLALFP